ncbi:TPA: STY4528 family pathogenicity island replication protein [Proteus mirabilis]|uniref:STY4528 family pathogenicity island replication protein n=1 Tax=Proteus mirabilis TaxID=584 RepID=UPI00162769BF|nr:STY4528 family pathogenicity island replication protein [Proteus mirabilis]MBB6683741.1 helix-turn-helix domain-containing protein [Proteus mirabilis]MBG2989671.1 helix-turn-helix domain-containing protein [Proteus mirabilis]HEJ9673425.1 helix-turn-helix domain-containing protein [Proteus mirabilis]HEK1098766.1 helix-turn-helix domain-containing protein [Proteus mirabilis]HEK2728760.1 helix-turn-helix domain-containing protein [Proteus mirabilis]
MATVPVDNIIQQTLIKMQNRIEQKAQSSDLSNEQSGLLFLGNVHDAIPRRLFLDSRLSPLDKMAWVMIRLYAQQNEGAIFPTYDELQSQLALPHSDKASRETISRALLMLRLTGWLSLCKRVRDNSGRIRGNIYAQHDEPLGVFECEYFDPSWLDTIAQACSHSNKTIRLTAISILQSIKTEKRMRHRHARVALIEARLSSPQTPQQMVMEKQKKTTSSKIELSSKSPSSETELSNKNITQIQSSISELSCKLRDCVPVRKSNRYVRSFTQSVKNTYTATNSTLFWSTQITERINPEDKVMLERQLEALPDGLGQRLLDDLADRMKKTTVRNPTAYLLANLKRAREGRFNLSDSATDKPLEKLQPKLPETVLVAEKRVIKRARREYVSGVMAELREAYFR